MGENDTGKIIPHETTIQAAYRSWITETVTNDNPTTLIEAFRAGVGWAWKYDEDIWSALNVSHETCREGHPVCECRNPPEHCTGGHPLDVSHETLTLDQRIERYRQASNDRDQLVRDLITAGWRKRDIAKRMRMGRPTIDRILGRQYPYDHGIERHTLPAPKVSHET